MSKIEEISTFDTGLCSDCIARKDNVILCTTYQLNENTKLREGGVFAFKKESKKSRFDSLREIEGLRIKTSGVFDVKFCPDITSMLFCLATSDGSLLFYEIEDQVKLISKTKINFFEDKSMCLYVDWREKNKVCVSHSNGQVSVVDLEKLSSETDPISWKAHDYEAWTVTFDNENTSILYSGGDDMKLKIWDLREPVRKAQKVLKDCTAGVCDIQMHPSKKSLFSSGSYDEAIRIHDKRKDGVIGKIECGGGVWRVRWNGKREDLVAAACMRNGFQIIKFNENMKQGACLAKLAKNEELAYGIDWVGESEEDNQFWLASCSFYDHQMQYWKVIE